MKKILVPTFASLLFLAACQQAPQATQTVNNATQETVAVSDESTASLTIDTQEEAGTEESSAGRMMKPVGDYHYDASVSDYVGSLYLEGMARIEQIEEGFCEENCQKFDYVFFEFNSDYDAVNKDFQEYLNQQGNNFTSSKGISIGCLEEHGIRRVTYKKTEGLDVESTISQTETETIVNSSEEAPVLVKLTITDPSPDTEAPDCFSHFNRIELVKIADNV
ncbi:MAG TPA: hypothetical protein VI588_00735 [Candidatus Gracilibacteria bacterium]|nr:hypothetical protein [Candidatus Gracilibacteria bacterium]